jgi:hypothetical protein
VDVERSSHKVMDNIYASAWKKVVFNVWRTCNEEDFVEEIMQDKVMESIIVSLIQSDSHGSDSEDDLC